MICEQIVNYNGGTISLASEGVDKGTTASFTFQASLEKSYAESTAADAPLQDGDESIKSSSMSDLRQITPQLMPLPSQQAKLLEFDCDSYVLESEQQRTIRLPGCTDPGNSLLSQNQLLEVRNSESVVLADG